MFADACQFTKSCPECAIMMGVGRRRKSPLHPIPVQRPFQILGIDVMDLPVTESGNRYCYTRSVHEVAISLCDPGPEIHTNRLPLG